MMHVIDKYSKKIIDFKINNLHVINYSTPQNKKITKNKLLKKLHFYKKLSKRYSLYNLLL